MKFRLGAVTALLFTIALAGAVAAQSPSESPAASPAGTPAGSPAGSPAASAAPSIGDIANLPHPAHIHSGSCANLGAIVAPLNDVALVDRSHRVGASTTDVDMKISDMLASPHAIMAHVSAQNLGTYIACADLTGPDPQAKKLVVALDEQNASGFAGVALLQEINGKTQVFLSLTAPASAPGTSPEPAGSGAAASMAPMSMAPASTVPASTAPLSTVAASAEPTGASSPAASAQSVTIQNLSFQPGSLTVPVGTTVTWTNNDSTQHTVTADDGSFDSGVLQQGATFSQTFTTAGTFAYHCNIHSTMHGTITVQ